MNEQKKITLAKMIKGSDPVIASRLKRIERKAESFQRGASKLSSGVCESFERFLTHH